MKNLIMVAITTVLLGLTTSVFAYTSAEIAGFNDKTGLVQLPGEDNGYAYVDKSSILKLGKSRLITANIFRFFRQQVPPFDAILMTVQIDCNAALINFGPTPVAREAGTGNLKQINGDPRKMQWERPAAGFQTSAFIYLCSQP